MPSKLPLRLISLSHPGHHLSSGAPRFKPVIQGHTLGNLPLLVYLSGMDGTGQLLDYQLADLAPYFEVWALVLPSHDRRSWLDLVADLQTLMRQLNPQGDRPLYLCGESFGGCLALHLLSRYPDLAHHLVLINPASAFSHNPWIRWTVPLIDWLAPTLYSLATVALLPLLANWDRVPDPQRQSLLAAMQSVSPETAAWRVSLLEQFAREPLPLNLIHQPTLIISGGNDRLLPSSQEAQRLQRQLPRAKTLLLPKSGHTCLLEPQVNLAQLLQEKHFLPPSPGYPSRITPLAQCRV